ncbi:MAG: cytochrome b/b6 domain-containing protein [Burkholderiales bacterium]
MSTTSLVRVWDLPTRLFHWLLAACVIGSVVTAKIGGNAMVWHFRLGYVVLTLLAFRLLWGVVGGRWSRFVSFIYSPQTVLRYLKGERPAQSLWDVGHNPLGAFSVFGLLAILLAQVATGLVADDEIANTGPLIRFVSGSVSSLATSWHRNWGQWIILALVALHVLAIAVYYFKKKQNLVSPMLHGDKVLSAEVPASNDSWRKRLLAVLLFALCAYGVAWLVGLEQVAG